jgi:hypothetical protein
MEKDQENTGKENRREKVKQGKKNLPKATILQPSQRPLRTPPDVLPVLCHVCPDYAINGFP